MLCVLRFVSMVCYNDFVGNKFKKPLLFVKRSDAKKGSIWNELTNKRIREQHGGAEELPENDIHAVKKFIGPILIPESSPEETNKALSALEHEINQLKEKEYTPSSPNTDEEDTHSNDTDQW